MSYASSTQRSRFTFASRAALDAAKASRGSGGVGAGAGAGATWPRAEEDAAVAAAAAAAMRLSDAAVRLVAGPGAMATATATGGVRQAVARTAVHVVRRTMARRGADEVDVPLVALAGVLVAGKVEEVRWPRGTHGSLQQRGFTMDRLMMAARDPAVRGEEEWGRWWSEATPMDVLVYERVVLETLEFCLLVHGPPGVSGNAALEKAEREFLAASDACLWMTPAQVAAELHRMVSSSSSGRGMDLGDEETRKRAMQRLAKRYVEFRSSVGEAMAEPETRDDDAMRTFAASSGSRTRRGGGGDVTFAMLGSDDDDDDDNDAAREDDSDF